MTVAATYTPLSYNGNGASVNFAASWRYLATAHLVVTRVNAGGSVTVLALGADYSATPGPTDAGGVVTCTVAPAAGTVLRIKRVTPRSQGTDYTTGDTFPAETHEAAIDRAMLIAQEQDGAIADTAARAVLVPDGESVATIPAAAARANKFLAFDATGAPIASSGTGTDAGLRADLATPALGTTLLAHPAGGTLQIYLNKVLLSPEQFGANGSSATLQQAFLDQMMVEARSVGKAIIRGTEGRTYTVDQPFLWGGLRDLEWQGNGAKMMNFRTSLGGLQDANIQPWRNPVPMLTNGTGLYVSGLDYGATIATAEAGATSLTILTGTLTVGRGWIFANDRFDDSGVPPTAVVREPIRITEVVGAVATLSQPLLHRYSALAPETLDAGTPRAGAARVVMLNRPAGAYAQQITMDSLRVFDLEFLVNPGWSYVTNGTPGFGGAIDIHLERIKAYNANVGQAEFVYMKDIEITHDLELDKMVGEVVLDGGDLYNVVGALGCSIVRTRGGCRIRNTFAPAPMELLDIGAGTRINAKHASVAFPAGDGTRSLIGTNAYGSAKVIIDSPIITVSNPNSDRVMEVNLFPWTPTAITATTLGSTRAVWNASGWNKQARVGTTFYFGSLGRGEITKLVEVPSGSLFTADVQIEYKLLGGPLPSGALTLTTLADVEVRGGITLEGPYARNVTSFHGTDDQAAGVKLSRVRTPNITDKGFWFDSRIAELARANSRFQLDLGRGFQPSELAVIVTRVATSGSAVGLRVDALKADGTLTGMIGSVDLKTLGRTELVQSGVSGLTGRGATVLGGTVTMGVATPGVVTFTTHGLANNQTVAFRTTGALLTGLAVQTLYYVRNAGANTFEVSLTSGGPSIAFSGTQSGVHSFYGLPIDPIVAAVAFDATNQGLAEGNRAHWKIVGEGDFL